MTRLLATFNSIYLEFNRIDNELISVETSRLKNWIQCNLNGSNLTRNESNVN